MFTIAVSLLAIAALYAAEGLQGSYAVLNFTDADFKDRIVQKPTLCLFYVNWCGYCKALMPQYIKAAESLVNDPTVALARVECDSNHNTCGQYVQGGYPTVIFFQGQNQTAYNSARTEDAIVKWVKENTLPTFTLVKTEEELDKLITGRKFALIGRFTSEESPALKVLKDSFDLGQTQAIRVALIDPNLARPSLVLKHIKDNFIEKFEEEDITKWTKEAISKFEQVHATNIIEDENPVETRVRLEKKGPVAFLFCDYAADGAKTNTCDELIKPLKDVAIKYRGKASFVIVDNKKFGVMKKSLGLPDAIPSFAVEVQKEKDASSGSTSRFKFVNGVGEDSVPTDGTSASPAQHAKADALKSYTPYNRIHYALQNTEAPNAITGDKISTFIDGILNGKIKTSIRAEKADLEGPIVHLDGSNFESVVLDPTKNVLVRFLVSSCVACAKKQPLFTRIAKDLDEIKSDKYSGDSSNKLNGGVTPQVKDTANKLVIAEIDVQDNDLPSDFFFPFDEFPTQLLFKARKEGDALKGKNKEVIRLGQFDSYEKMKRFLKDELAGLYEGEFPLVVNSKVIEDEDEIEFIEQSMKDGSFYNKRKQVKKDAPKKEEAIKKDDAKPKNPNEKEL